MSEEAINEPNPTQANVVSRNMEERSRRMAAGMRLSQVSAEIDGAVIDMLMAATEAMSDDVLEPCDRRSAAARYCASALAILRERGR